MPRHAKHGRGNARSTWLADGLVTTANVLRGGGTALDVVFVEYRLSDCIRWTYEPGRIGAHVFSQLRRTDSIIRHGKLLHGVRLERDGDNHTSSDVRALPATPAAPEHMANVKFSVTHSDVVG